jgi:hypothetical protein
VWVWQGSDPLDFFKNNATLIVEVTYENTSLWAFM